jgi:predicted dienelactone hydrolase
MRAGALVAAVLLAGCAAAPPTPDATKLYAPSRAGLATHVDDSVGLTASDGRAIPLRVVYPEGKGPWPVIVFSHGMFSSNEMYMPILEHWASQGYVIVAPDHLDAKGKWQPRQNSDVEVLATSRASDLTLVMDSIPKLEEKIPPLAKALLPPPYAAAGHSMGTYIAMLEAGLRTKNPNTEEVISHPDRRIGYVVMSSDPGKMALMPEDLWLGLTVPTFMTTGTKDYGVSGKGRRATEYTMDRLSGGTQKTGFRYRVLIQDGDHYYGGLVHRAPSDVKPDPEALNIYTSLSTAFLDAYLKKDRGALEYLKRVDVTAVTGGRAGMTVE